MREAISAARRGHELVVLDLARQGGSLVEELVARCDHLLVVTPATVPAAAATGRLVARLPSGGSRHLLLRDGMVSPAEMARATGIAVLGGVPRQRGLEESIDLGLGPVRAPRGALARFAEQVLDALPAERGRAAA